MPDANRTGGRGGWTVLVYLAGVIAAMFAALFLDDGKRLLDGPFGYFAPVYGNPGTLVAYVAIVAAAMLLHYLAARPETSDAASARIQLALGAVLFALGAWQALAQELVRGLGQPGTVVVARLDHVHLPRRGTHPRAVVVRGERRDTLGVSLDLYFRLKGMHPGAELELHGTRHALGFYVSDITARR